jgi:hypothetical protein
MFVSLIFSKSFCDCLILKEWQKPDGIEDINLLLCGQIEPNISRVI